MGKLILYLSILMSILTVLSLLGLIQGSTMGFLFTLMKDPSMLFSSEFFVSTFTVLSSIAVGTGIAIGFYITGKGDMAIKAPLAILLLPIGHDIVALYVTVLNYGTVSFWIASLFISPIAILFILAVVDWWGGET